MKNKIMCCIDADINTLCLGCFDSKNQSFVLKQPTYLILVTCKPGSICSLQYIKRTPPPPPSPATYILYEPKMGHRLKDELIDHRFCQRNTQKPRQQDQ